MTMLAAKGRADPTAGLRTLRPLGDTALYSTTVSYTHLDVYKRQRGELVDGRTDGLALGVDNRGSVGQQRCRVAAVTGRRGGGVHGALEGVDGLLGRLELAVELVGVVAEGAQIDGCLLYTSRCV